jgi:hypothetical protein
MSARALWKLSFLLLAFGFVLASSAIRALTVPWGWTSDQIHFAGYLALLALAGCTCIYIWARYGAEALKARWQIYLLAQKRPRSNRVLLISLFSWLVIAAGLVVFFYFMKL